MKQLLKKIFGMTPQTDFTGLIKNGAQVIDVRTKKEFEAGHIKGAINIPLDTLQTNFSYINKNKAVIACCASGIRSASAVSILKSKGFTLVYNGGGWMDLQKKIS